MGAKPVLWQIKVSHYSEKVRWALDYKAVEHDRKAPPPGPHMLFALAKSRGAAKTFPLLELDGRTYADSTDIVAALEDHWPDPPLYPADPAERDRALALEEFFDEEVGPYTRLYAWHEITRDREIAAGLIANELPAPLRSAAPVMAPLFGAFLHARYGVQSDEAATEARRKIAAGFDRIETELGGRDYLVGHEFTVADLTAAALFYPTVLPAEGPQLPDPPPAYAEFQATLADRPGFEWVERMWREHRRRGAARSAAAV